jgi:hypothetical protein
MPVTLIPPERPAPRPGAALAARIGRMRSVRTRIPARTLAGVALVALAYPLYAFWQFPLRADLGALPGWWFLPVALLWLAGFALPLVLALLPRRAQVLPDEGAAGLAALAAAVILSVVSFFTIDAPGRTIIPAATWDAFSHAWWHCISFGLRIVLPVLVAGTVALARVMLVGPARLGAALGAAGGALSGLTLHGLCPLGGVLHVLTAHAGAVVLGAVLGAIVFPVVRSLVERLSR